MLFEEAETGDNSAAQVGAAKAAFAAERDLIELQLAMGRMPYSLHRRRAEADFNVIVKRCWP